jgi:hypothetical protein
MRLAWTAIVPRQLVTEIAPDSPLHHGSRYLTVAAHPNPALCVVRCYQPGWRAERPPAA